MITSHLTKVLPWLSVKLWFSSVFLKWEIQTYSSILNSRFRNNELKLQFDWQSRKGLRQKRVFNFNTQWFISKKNNVRFVFWIDFEWSHSFHTTAVIVFRPRQLCVTFVSHRRGNTIITWPVSICSRRSLHPSHHQRHSRLLSAAVRVYHRKL